MPTEMIHTEERVVTVGAESESFSMESPTSEMQVTAAGGAAARMVVDTEETSPRPHGKTDSPSKKKGNTS